VEVALSDGTIRVCGIRLNELGVADVVFLVDATGAISNQKQTETRQARQVVWPSTPVFQKKGHFCRVQ
jgi:hypothetical protein